MNRTVGIVFFSVLTAVQIKNVALIWTVLTMAPKGFTLVAYPIWLNLALNVLCLVASIVFQYRFIHHKERK